MTSRRLTSKSTRYGDTSVFTVTTESKLENALIDDWSGINKIHIEYMHDTQNTKNNGGFIMPHLNISIM